LWCSGILSADLHPVSLRCIFILYSYGCLGLPSDLFIHSWLKWYMIVFISLICAIHVLRISYTLCLLFVITESELPVLILYLRLQRQ
jgi:hypothetical protein